MKKFIKILVLLITVFQFNNLPATESITGTWQGKLITGPGAKVTIQFVITQDAKGSYYVILNSLDEGGMKNVKANSVVYTSGVLKIDAAEVSGSYEGIVKDGKIDGKWKQEGSSFPLMLSPYEKPTFSKKDIDTLLGSWNGKLSIPGGSLIAIFRFEMSEKGEFVGFSDWPDNGGYGAPLTDMEINEGNLSLKIPIINGEYEGKFTDNEIVGEYKMAGVPVTLPLTLKKGEYVATVYGLSLPKEIMDQLSGKWIGELPPWDTKSDPVNVVFRFEKSKSGDFTGFMDMPDKGVKGLSIIEANLDDGKITLKIIGASVPEFKGQLSGDKLVGEWTVQEKDGVPLSLTKEKP